METNKITFRDKLIYQKFCECHCGTVLRVWKNGKLHFDSQRYRVQLQVPRDIKCHLTKKNRFYDIFVENLPIGDNNGKK